MSQPPNANQSAEPAATPADNPEPTGARLPARLVKIVLGSALFVSLKMALVYLIETTTPLPAWLNYGIVTVGISLLGWVYHSKISFQQPLTRRTLVRYVQQAIALKVADYVLYNGLVYVLHVNLVLAVLLTGGLVFTTRVIVYLKYVFVPPARGRDAGVVGPEA